jgi:hypothetical protein
MRFGLAALAAVAASGSACLGGCAASSGRAREAMPPPAVPPAPAAVSYDFAPLLPAPFGTSFKEVPVPLTEVLVFHEGTDSRANEDKDCFRPNGSVVFLGHPPTEYLICFDHDRLKRIEASVALPAAQAPAVFAAACAEWQGRAPAQAIESDACDGRRGDIDFSARRSSGPEPSVATVSITLIDVRVP